MESSSTQDACGQKQIEQREQGTYFSYAAGHVDTFSAVRDDFGLPITVQKTEVWYQLAPGQPYQDRRVSVKQKIPQAVNAFTYLGSTLSHGANIDAEVNNSIAKVSGAFGRLRATVWERCAPWTAYGWLEKLLNHFHLRCLQNLPHICWQDNTSDSEFLEKAGILSIITTQLGRSLEPHA